MLIQFSTIPKGLYSTAELMNFFPTLDRLLQFATDADAHAHMHINTFGACAQINMSPLMCSTAFLEEKYVNSNFLDETTGDYSYSFVFYSPRG